MQTLGWHEIKSLFGHGICADNEHVGEHDCQFASGHLPRLPCVFGLQFCFQRTTFQTNSPLHPSHKALFYKLHVT